jgi:beta-galactosidase
MEFPRQGNSGGWNLYDKPLVNPTTTDLHLQWDVPYEPGVLKAIGKKDGKIVCTEEIHTTGVPAAIKLEVDRDTILSGQRDIAHVKIEIVDDNGNIVSDANNLVQFTIDGEGKNIGVDNGNPFDHDSYKLNQRNAFNGLALIVIQSTNENGVIRLNAKSDGLKQAEIKIVVRKGKPIPAL